MNLFDVLFAKKLSGGGSPFPPVIKRVTGNPVEFTDGADAPLVKCVTEIQGSQDLHGQDKPWVGGAGKNKLPNSLASSQSQDGITVVSDGNGTYTVSGTATALTTIEFDLVKSYVIPVSVAKGGNGCFNLHNSFTGSVNVVLFNGSTQVDSWILNTVNRYSASYTSMGGRTITKIAIRVGEGETINGTVSPMFTEDETSTYSAFSPYSNICPITAYDENTISVGGNEYNGADNFTVFNSGTSIVVQANDKRLVSKGVPVNNNDLVLIKFDNSQFKLSSMFYYDNPTITVGSIANNQVISLENKSGEYKFKATNGGYVYFYFAPNENRNVSPSELSDTIVCVMKDTHTTTYPSAIYRGSEDCVKGEVTTSLKVVDMGDIPWVYNEQYNYFSANLYDLKKYANNVTPDMYCECYAVINSRYGSAMGGVGNGVICPRADQSYIQVKETAYTDATQFKNSVTGMILAYELATPTTSSVTPTNLPIKSLSGYNHIESSTGDMTIDYITDAYQNFVDTVESALPNTTRNLLSASKGGVKAFDIFKTLDEPKKPEAPAEESEPEEKEIEEGAKK